MAADDSSRDRWAGLGEGQPIGGHQPTYQTTVQVSGWELGQGHISRYTSADIPGHSTGQWLLTHRFSGIFPSLIRFIASII